jgi:hypothetical protein
MEDWNIRRMGILPVIDVQQDDHYRILFCTSRVHYMLPRHQLSFDMISSEEPAAWSVLKMCGIIPLNALPQHGQELRRGHPSIRGGLDASKGGVPDKGPRLWSPEM